MVNDFHAIKRMRLDSSEKNIQHELERTHQTVRSLTHPDALIDDDDVMSQVTLSIDIL